MKKQTQLFIFNEDGLITSELIKHFSLDFMQKSMFSFNIKWKSDIDILSTIFSKLLDEDLEFTIYDYGYVLKLEGSLLKTILFLKDFDNYLDEHASFYISPSQVVENNDEQIFLRGSKLKEIALFLDKLFCTTDYSKAISDF